MTNAAPNSEPAPDELRGLAGFFAKFSVLKNAMRELWLSFFVKLLIIAAYAVTNSTLVLWASSDLGYSDKTAIFLIGAWSLIMSIGNVLVGSLTDAIGLRKTFFIGVGICIVTRAVMTFSTVPWLALAGGLFPLAFGEALTGPVLVAAARCYSNTKQRSISFSLLYMMMNLGFLVANFIFDFVRRGLGEHGHLTVPILGVTLTTYRALFLSSLILQILVWPLIYLFRDGAEATEQGMQIVPKPAKYKNAGVLRAFYLTSVSAIKDTAGLFGRLFQQSGFYRLLAFLLFVAFLKLVYRQMDYVYPKVGIRLMGGGAPIGHILAINNFFVILLLPIVGALTQRFSAYAMVILGGVITAASVFILAVPTGWFEPLTGGIFGQVYGHWYLGLNGKLDAFYVEGAIFVVLFSFGEAFYSPRVYEYAASIAPKGQEASYSALSYVPFIMAKLITATISGTLMEKYCPESGARHPGTMWLIIGLTACVAPIGLVLLGRFIRVREAGRSD